MPGSLLQLVAYGAQDIYLSGNPQVTFFRSMYRRHTNFAVESIQNSFTGKPSFGSKVTATIARNGDLLSRVYVRVVLSGGTATGDAKWAWVKNLGFALLHTTEFSIGGQVIDTHDSKWMHMWHELARPLGKDRAFDAIIGNTEELTTLATSHEKAVLYIPLQFFFCRHIGLVAPIIAMQYHDLKIDIRFEDVNQLIVTSGFTSSSPANELGLTIEDASLYCDYIFLDTDERRRFAQQAHELLVEQTQRNGVQSIHSSVERIPLQLNHPVKEVVWAVAQTKFTNRSGSHKYLWYHPHSIDALRLIATKRFALATAKYNGNFDTLAFSQDFMEANSLLPSDTLPANLETLFQRIKPVAITTDPVLENVTILGDLLTLEEISQTVDELFGTFADDRPTSVNNHGSSLYDVVVRMPFNFGMNLDGSNNPLESAVIQLNGHDRFTPRDATYFQYIQTIQHHTNTPPSDGINVYSFALHPEEHQPSGTLNFSRIDTAVLSFTLKSSIVGDIYIYGFSYNVLRVMSGMAGLAFSN